MLKPKTHEIYYYQIDKLVFSFYLAFFFAYDKNVDDPWVVISQCTAL